ncbi:MobF family relaxase [Okibacterium endophyticum]
MAGGFKAFRAASPKAGDVRAASGKASDYLLERDAARLDDYYAEGEDRAIQHVVLHRSQDGGKASVDESTFSSDEFRAWIEHTDPATGEKRGGFRTHKYVNGEGEEVTGSTPLYHEKVVTASKSLSIAAASDPRIAEALENAQARAVVRAAEAMEHHAVTRMGPQNAQYQVRLDRVECTSVQHKTSRSGDPHFHRHMQVLPKGYAEGKWRSFHGTVLYRLSDRMNAAADLAMARDEELRQAIADAGYTWAPSENGGGVVLEFEPFVDDFSQRRAAIDQERESLEAQWRTEHPDEDPGPRLKRSWDQLGWAKTRPEKSRKSDVLAEDAQGQTTNVALIERDEVAARIPTVAPRNVARVVAAQTVDQIDPRAIAEGALVDLAQRRSAWSPADLHAAIDRRLAMTYLVGDDGVDELHEQALQAAQGETVSFLDDGVQIEGVRHLTAKAVVKTENDLTDALTRRAERSGEDGLVEADRGAFSLTEGQAAAARGITGNHALVVVEGAAGSGKTSMLAAANEQLKLDGRRLVSVSPTKRGAEEMAQAVKGKGNSVHSMLVRAGASFDETGRWTLPTQWKPQPREFAMDEDTVVVVDECGMLDQETAAALHRYVDDQGVGSLVLMGDTRQLSAVGRGGYLAKAAGIARQTHDLQDVQRFRTKDTGETDKVYAAASLKLREREEVEEFFELLASRGAVRTGTSDEVIGRVAETMALEIAVRQETSVAVASTNATAQQINFAVYDRLVAADVIDASRVVKGRDGDPIARGARVATRLNDRDLKVANRQTWTVERVNEDGRVVVRNESTGHRSTLGPRYVQDHLQLAYAVTTHGSQGMTVDHADFLLSEQADAAAAYVALTRGRHSNTLHAVAVDMDDARDQFVAAVDREGADQGLDAAKKQVQRDVAGLAQSSRFDDVLQDIDMSWLDQYRSASKRQGEPARRQSSATPARKRAAAPEPAAQASVAPVPVETVAERRARIEAHVAELGERAAQEARDSAQRIAAERAAEDERLAGDGWIEDPDEPGTLRRKEETEDSPQAVLEKADAELQRIGEQHPNELAVITQNIKEGNQLRSPGASSEAIDAKVRKELRVLAYVGRLDEDVREMESAAGYSRQLQQGPRGDSVEAARSGTAHAAHPAETTPEEKSRPQSEKARRLAAAQARNRSAREHSRAKDSDGQGFGLGGR